MNSTGPTTDEGYTLRYGPSATAAIKSSLHLSVRPHLQDVRAMLRLPLPDSGITAGCNFAAVHVLLNVLSGLQGSWARVRRGATRRSVHSWPDGIHGDWSQADRFDKNGARKRYMTLFESASRTIWACSSKLAQSIVEAASGQRSALAQGISASPNNRRWRRRS